MLIAAALALAELGPGPLSLDGLRGRERAGAGWALAAFGAGAIGALGVQQATARQAPPEVDAVPESSDPDQAPAPTAQAA